MDISYKLAFCTSFGVTRTVCGAYSGLFAPTAMQIMLHLWGVNGSTAPERFCFAPTH